MTVKNNNGPFNHFHWSEKIQANTSNIKTCLFNLIIYTNEQRRATYFQDIVRMISSQFPCRVIFIWGDDYANEPYLRFRQAFDEETKEVGSNEQFLIETSKEYLNRVPFVVLPYLIPDLPVYLLWGQDPSTENVILPHLQKYATQLIFDSESSENLQRFSQTMLAKSKCTQIAITDMNWARIGNWRDILAKTFDSQERIDQLSSANLIIIKYNSRSSDLSLHPATQAIFLQAWLATQLGWKFESLKKEGPNFILNYKSDQHTHEVRIQGELRNDMSTSEIMTIEVSDQNNFLYSINRKTENQILVHCNTIDRCELPFTLFLPNLWSARNFMQEIFYKKTSSQYFNMLHQISSISWSTK